MVYSIIKPHFVVKEIILSQGYRTVITLDIDLFHAVFSANLQNLAFMDWRDSNPIQRKGTLIIFMKRFQTSKLRISEAD
jgi:hypothetical protein